MTRTTSQPKTSGEYYMDHPNDIAAKRLEKTFASPVPDKVKNVVEKTRGGYILVEKRPPWDSSPGDWTRLQVAKIIYNKSGDVWKLYWMRASGKWNLYEECESLGNVIETIRTDPRGCFWG